MDTEYHALLNNNTWLLVPPPPHGNIIRSIGILIILIYVDDISGTRSSATQIHSFISRLSSVFALRDLGPIIYFLDIKASCPDDHPSTSGYCLFLGPNMVSWSSSKQKVVSRSSAESEYRTLAFLTAEIV
ncbi:putative mitochondrial protein [Vitis vinifera]|uniref:Putative mitochondrial protein n=1 Tax=Vitis vinifera TaxID=29760 RepID=A0A438DHE4_VITVI|nr:putative mitochondrial protein [Vitis vinifera]